MKNNLIIVVLYLTIFIIIIFFVNSKNFSYKKIGTIQKKLYKNISQKNLDNNPKKFTWNSIDSHKWYTTFKHHKFYYSIGSNTTHLEPKSMTLRKFKDSNFSDGVIFHNLLETPDIFHIVTQLIPIPLSLSKKLRISRFYAGSKYTGTNLHNHTPALNYLITGKKLWIMCPSTKINNQIIKDRKMDYGKVTTSSKEWFQNTDFSGFENLIIFEQNSNEIVYIPDKYYHAIINLSYTQGITYSWFT